MRSPDGRFAIVYNGELYNHEEVRSDLRAAGVELRTRSDTEAVLMALATFGIDALRRLRGMYAIGFADLKESTLLLARDPLGVKPLYYVRRSESEIAFASEIGALLEIPGVSDAPDNLVVTSYLCSVRTTLGDRTLYSSVRTLRPGESLLFAPGIGRLRTTRSDWWDNPPTPQDEDVRTAVADSLRRHMVSDVPLCCLLSGGLDSTILATLAADQLAAPLRTYCSGSHAGPDPRGAAGGDDFHHAALVAAEIGSVHREAPVSRELFADRWPEMVRAMRAPLSTPNEVAINVVASALRADGAIVTLSGEGADELFGGYDMPLARAAAYEAARDAPNWRESGRWAFDSNTWIGRDALLTMLEPAVAGEFASHVDEAREACAAEFERLAARGAMEDPLQVHLRYQRRVNLEGLLRRFDSATMLAGVEGRTPFADAEVCMLAESLPVTSKFAAGVPVAAGPREQGASSRYATKIALREAFAESVPPAVMDRAKASFPLPFQSWIEDHADALTRSSYMTQLFTPAALHTIARNAPRVWNAAWPMINLALWRG